MTEQCVWHGLPDAPAALHLSSCRKSVIRFRNYKPADAGLVSSGLAVVLPQPALPSAAVKDAEKAELARLLAAPVRVTIFAG